VEVLVESLGIGSSLIRRRAHRELLVSDDWLGKDYNVQPVPVKERECNVLTPHWRPDRTHHIEIRRVEILDRRFLQHVQAWIMEKGKIWRVSIPTDDTDENLIMVYSEKIAINEHAERNLDEFLHMIRPLLQKAFERTLQRDTLLKSIKIAMQ